MCYQTQQASLQLFCHGSTIESEEMIKKPEKKKKKFRTQLLLILMTNAGRLKDRNKQTNRQITKTRPLDFVIMGYEILAPAKHALVVQKMDSAIHHINHYPEDKY